MTITYPLALPTPTRVRSVRWRQQSVVAVSRSPFTGQRQVQRHAGQWWEVDVVLPPMTRDAAAAWIAWWTSLNGPEGTFLLGDVTYPQPRGTAAGEPGTPLVKGAGQTGATLAIDGLPATTAGYLRAGDFVQLGTGSSSRLHQVLADASSNGSGEATLDIWPRLRSSPADNAAVVVSAAKGVFAMTGTADWQVDTLRHYGLSFSAIEVV